MDNDTREHDVNTYELALNPDKTRMEVNGLTAADCMDFTPMTARVKVHYHSKNAPTSPTTLEITADFAMGSSSVSVDASFKTASPWVMEPNPTGEVVNILEATQEQNMVLLVTILSNLTAISAVE